MSWLVCNVPEPGERPRLPAGFVPARTRIKVRCLRAENTAPYGSCNSAHFDDHQLHDDLQFAGRQLSNSLSYPRPVGVWNHDIERHGKYSVFVNLL